MDDWIKMCRWWLRRVFETRALKLREQAPSDDPRHEQAATALEWLAGTVAVVPPDVIIEFSALDPEQGRPRFARDAGRGNFTSSPQNAEELLRRFISAEHSKEPMLAQRRPLSS